MTLLDWTSAMTPLLDPFGSVMIHRAGEDWRQWALNVSTLLGLSQDTVNPYGFSDWKDWAIRFSEVADPLLDR